MPVFSFIGHLLTEFFRKTDNWSQIYKQKSVTSYTSNDVYFQNNVLRRKIIRTLEQGSFFINLLKYALLGVHME